MKIAPPEMKSWLRPWIALTTYLAFVLQIDYKSQLSYCTAIFVNQATSNLTARFTNLQDAQT